MRNLIVCVLLVISVFSLNAQNNSIFSELGGNGFFGSINYERKLSENPKILGRVGIGFWSDFGFLGSKTTSGFTIPISTHYLCKIGEKSYMDFGLGTTILESQISLPNANKYILYFFTSIGYRRDLGANIFFRIHVTPYFTNITKNVFYQGDPNFLIEEESFEIGTNQWLGISFGYKF